MCSQWVAFVRPPSDEVICDVPFGVSSLPDKGALKALHPREGGTDGFGDFDPNRLVRCRPGEPFSVTQSAKPVSPQSALFRVQSLHVGRKPEMARHLLLEKPKATDAIQTRAHLPPLLLTAFAVISIWKSHANGRNSKIGFSCPPTPAGRADNNQSNDFARSLARSVWVSLSTPSVIIGATKRNDGRHCATLFPLALVAAAPMFLSIIHWSERSKPRIASNGENCPRSLPPSLDRSSVRSSGKSCHVHRRRRQ